MNEHKVFNIECLCSSPEHALKISLWENEEDFYISTYGLQLTFWRRVAFAFKYVFRFKFPDFSETVVSRKDAEKLRDILTEWLEK